MPKPVQDLITQLRDFRNRKSAIQALVALGSEAVDALAEAAGAEHNAGARWAILSVLGRIGEPRAIPVLAAHLDEPDFREVAHAALVSITGRDLGYGAQAWLVAAGQPGKPEPAPASSSAPSPAPPPAAQAPLPHAGELDPEEMIRLAVAPMDAALACEEEDEYRVDVRLKGGRQQHVRVAFGKRDHEGEKIVIVYTECGPARPDLYETILRKNMQMPYGAVAVRDVRGAPMFVMFNTLCHEGLTPHALHKSIRAIADRADRIEKLVTRGGDTY